MCFNADVNNPQIRQLFLDAIAQNDTHRYSTACDRRQIIEVLLKRGIGTTFGYMPLDNENPLYLAAINLKPELVKLLLAYDLSFSALHFIDYKKIALDKKSLEKIIAIETIESIVRNSIRIEQHITRTNKTLFKLNNNIDKFLEKNKSDLTPAHLMRLYDTMKDNNLLANKIKTLFNEKVDLMFDDGKMRSIKSYPDTVDTKQYAADNQTSNDLPPAQQIPAIIPSEITLSDSTTLATPTQLQKLIKDNELSIITNTVPLKTALSNLNPNTSQKPNYEELYQNQEKNRPWYKSGYFILALSILFVPLTAIFYYFWQASRKQEPIQKISLSPQELNQIRFNRQTFKKAAGIKPDLNPSVTNNASTKKQTHYMHRSKYERIVFFQKPQLVITEELKNWLENSKNKTKAFLPTLLYCTKRK